MRIAIVLDYSLDLLGGAQRAALNSAAALVAAGHSVLLVAPRPAHTGVAGSGDLAEPNPRIQQHQRGVGLPAGVLPCWTDARRLPGFDFPLVADDAELRAHLTRRFREERVDAVHLHSEFGHARAAAAAARRLGLPVLHTVHTAYWPAVPAPLVPIARRLLARLAGPVPAGSPNPLLDHTLATARTADVVLSPSAHQARDLAAYGVDRIELLPNCGADERAPQPLPSADGLRVAWVGRCVPEKRLLTFVRAVGMAQRRLPASALQVAVAGDGVLRRSAQVLAAGTPGIAFLGRLDAREVAALLAASHLTALTSFGFDNPSARPTPPLRGAAGPRRAVGPKPMTVVESVQAGRGVLHVDPRLTEGLATAGLLTRSPDARGIADLLVELALDRDPVREAASGAAATTVFSPAVHAGRILALAKGQGPLPLLSPPGARIGGKSGKP